MTREEFVALCRVYEEAAKLRDARHPWLGPFGPLADAMADVERAREQCAKRPGR